MRFASKITGQVDLDGESVDIHALNGKKLEKARNAARGEAVAAAKEAGADLVRVFHELSKAEKEGAITPEIKRKARYAQYDRDTVLAAGVTRFASGVKAEDAIEECMEEDLQKIHEAILDLSLPALDAAPKD